MNQAKVRSFQTPGVRSFWLIFAVLCAVVALPLCAAARLWYSETKGPFKNWTQTADLDGDGDLDVLVSHTRWEQADLAWAGIGRWINQGDGNFQLLPVEPGGFAAAAGNLDQDGRTELLVQEFNIRFLRDTGDGSGKLRSGGGINFLMGRTDQYRDMGGTIVLGDWSGDGLLDAFIAGCCYGQSPTKPGSNFASAPSRSWLWINAGEAGQPAGPLAALDGIPVRQAASGDLDGDGDLDLYAAVGAPTLGSPVSLADQLLLNDGTGKFFISAVSLSDPDSSAAALGDVNKDGRLDALVGKRDGAALLINQGNGPDGAPLFALSDQNFAPAPSPGMAIQAAISGLAENLFGWYLPSRGAPTQSVFLSDLDADGDIDTLIARLRQAEIWWNDGSGRFEKSAQRFTYSEDTGAAVADFNSDSAPDIFLGANHAGFQLWWNDGGGVFSAVRP